MTDHLEDREIAAVLAGGDPGSRAVEHLESCLGCRREIDRLGELVSRRRAELASQAPDWGRQRDRIMDRLPPAAATRDRAGSRWLRPLLAAAAVLVVAVGLRLAWLPSAPTGEQSRTDLAVEEILAEVDEVLADDSLPGFEPIDPGFEIADAYLANGSS